MIIAAIAAFALVSGPVSDRAADRVQPARVYVHESPDPPPADPEEQRGLDDSRRDVIEAMGRRKADFVLVDSPDAADVVVEIVNREERNVPQGGFGGASVTKFRETIVRLRVKAGERQADLKGIGRPSWKSAAKDAVERLARWVKNR